MLTVISYSSYPSYEFPDVPIIVPQDGLVLDDFLGTGKQANETDLPEEEGGGNTVTFNEGAMSQLEAMGFPAIRCQKALLATGNSDPEAAMNWLFAHMEDPGMNFVVHVQESNLANAISITTKISILLFQSNSFAQVVKQHPLRKAYHQQTLLPWSPTWASVKIKLAKHSKKHWATSKQQSNGSSPTQETQELTKVP